MQCDVTDPAAVEDAFATIEAERDAVLAEVQAALDLADSGHQVYLVERQPSIGGIMAQLDKVYPDIEYSENADAEVSDLLAEVAAGNIDLTVADSTEFNIQRHFYPDLRIALDLELDDKLAWAFPKGYGDSLLARADEFSGPPIGWPTPPRCSNETESTRNSTISPRWAAAKKNSGPS